MKGAQPAPCEREGQGRTVITCLSGILSLRKPDSIQPGGELATCTYVDHMGVTGPGRSSLSTTMPTNTRMQTTHATKEVTPELQKGLIIH